jgi:hypothetical protein
MKAVMTVMRPILLRIVMVIKVWNEVMVEFRF